MQLIITDAWLAKTRTIHVSGLRLVAVAALFTTLLIMLSLGVTQWIFLKTASSSSSFISRWIALDSSDEQTKRDRFLKENINVLARRMGEIQARVMQLESLGERISGLAGSGVAPSKNPIGRGGVLVAAAPMTMSELEGEMSALEQITQDRSDTMAMLETRLFDRKMKNMLLPTGIPVEQAMIGSAFGWRVDPITGESALHTGLDFQADKGTPILAAAGGVVVVQEYHPAYGNMVEIDHGNNLVTRYAHAMRMTVRKGDLVKRGQLIGEVGTTGRSTGPHLHFEVLANGVQQDPQKFLDSGKVVSVSK